MTNQAYTSILTESQLNDYCQQILANSAITWIAIDTEFVRVDTYFPELSLVQIQDSLGHAAIIDPIAIQNSSDSHQPLNALVKLLADPTVVKVFHSARQDIEVLYLLQKEMPAAIFDTQIASIFRKHGDIAGFARVIEQELHTSLDKSQTRTNWHNRPLTEKQIEYALDDVRYLAPLYEKYLSELSKDELLAVQEDSQALLNESLYNTDPATAGDKVKGTKGLKPKGLAIVNALAQWREEFAIEHNRPKRWVMSDEVIVHIAKRPPQTVQALYKVPNIKASSVKGYGEQWIELIDGVFASNPESYPSLTPKIAKETPQEEIIMHFANAYIHQVACDYKMTPSHLISKSELLTLIRNPGELKLTGWRQQLIGQPLKQLFSAEAQLRLQNQRIVLQDVVS
ncbi:MAG: HRDC domain-containing protein [Thiomicrorhabdus sp.]|nr:HRDC domain-containing protein [Thiomicrorhabdus sp.]